MDVECQLVLLDDESAPNHQELSAPSGSDHNVAISGRSSRRGTTKEKSSSRQTRVAEIKQENVDETPHKNEGTEISFKACFNKNE